MHARTRAHPLLCLLLFTTLGGCARDATLASSSRSRAVVSEGPQLPIAVAGHAGGLVRGMPVVVGGSSWSADGTAKTWHHECFIFENGRWRDGPSLPRRMSDSAYASGSHGLIIAGGTDGKQPSQSVSLLTRSDASATWQALPDLPVPIESAAGAIANDTFYVVGGYVNSKASNRVFSLQLTNVDAGWKELAPLPAAGRGYAAAVVIRSTLYVFGGFNYPPYASETEIFSDVNRYDIKRDRWSRVKGLNLTGYAWTATAVDDDSIMLTGRVPELNVISNDILLLNLRTWGVRSIGKLVIQACCMPAIKVEHGTWWLPGGEPGTNRDRTARTSVIRIKD